MAYFIGYCKHCGRLYEYEQPEQVLCPDCEEKDRKRKAELAEWLKEFEERINTDGNLI